MNSTEYFNSSFEVGYPTTDKVISGTAWVLMQFPCNALIFGLVQFDRLGGDPLKRRVTDQVSGFFSLLKNKTLID